MPPPPGSILVLMETQLTCAIMNNIAVDIGIQMSVTWTILIHFHRRQITGSSSFNFCKSTYYFSLKQFQYQKTVNACDARRKEGLMEWGGKGSSRTVGQRNRWGKIINTRDV